MAELKHGTITLVIADELTPPENAGKLDPLEVSRIPKVPRGIGKLCADTADALEKAGAKLSAPKDVTAASLRSSGDRAERIEQVLQDVAVIWSILKQSCLLFKAEAYEQVRKVNDQVRAQGKHDQEILTIFAPTTSTFARLRRRRTPPPDGNSTVPVVEKPAADIADNGD